MFNDSTLQRLTKDYEGLVISQQQIIQDIQSINLTKNTETIRLRQKFEQELEREESKFDQKIKDLERQLETIKRRIPDISRDIEKRQAELMREAAKKVA